MRNLKKILALVLALVMSMSLVTVSSAAFTDEASIDETYAESAEVLAALGVFQGYTDGSFNPKGSITRQEVAAVIYRIATGDVEDKQAALYAGAADFSDEIPAWSAGYIGYCATNNLVKGYEDGTFRPTGKVTGFEALVMILRAVGYDAMNEFTGANWSTNAAARAKSLGITDNIKPGVLVGAATREVVAEILFRAMMVPQVVYTPAFGYETDKFAATEPSLGWQNFGLVCVNGLVSEISREKGITYFELVENTPYHKAGDVVRVANTVADWTNIGFNGYIYATINVGAKNYTAVSTGSVYGKSLAVSTDDTNWNELTVAKKTKVVDVAADARYFVNGIETTKAAATALVGNVGVKVEFVDNDYIWAYDGGLADAVIVTAYDVAAVTGVANDYNTGANAIVRDCYYLTGNGHYFNDKTDAYSNGLYEDDKVEMEDVIGAELTYGDVITYVIYDGEYYVTVAPFVEDTFKKINYKKTTEDLDSYVIGDVTYLKSYKFLGDADLLAKDNLGEDVVVYTDPYGYMLLVTEFIDPSQYLYVVRHNHSNAVLGTTFATVVLADGSVLNVDLAKSNLNLFNTITPDMYTYTVGTTGVYTLGKTCATYPNATVGADEMVEVKTDYTATNPTLKAGVYFTNSSVVIDVRNVKVGATTATVYETYKAIPSMKDAEFHCVVDEDGFVILAFLSAGTNVSAGAAADSFIVYNTEAHYFDGKNYYLNVVAGGAITEKALSKDQYADVCALGVGIYNYAAVTKALTYTSFVEVWKPVTWKDGSIVVGNTAYSYADNVVFFTFDINPVESVAYDYKMNLGNDALAYVVPAPNSYSATQIFVIYGDVASTTTGVKAAYTKGGAYNYYFEHGFVTEAVAIAPVETDNKTIAALADAIVAYEAAVEALKAAVNTLNTLNLAAESASAATTFVEAIAAVEAAGEALDEAATVLAAAQAKVNALDKTKLTAAEVETIDALADDAEIVAAVLTQVTTKAATVIPAAVVNAADAAAEAYEAAVLAGNAAAVEAALAEMAAVYVLNTEIGATIENETFIEKAPAAALESVKATAWESLVETAEEALALIIKTETVAKTYAATYVAAADAEAALATVLAANKEQVEEALEYATSAEDVLYYISLGENYAANAWDAAIEAEIEYQVIAAKAAINALAKKADYTAENWTKVETILKDAIAEIVLAGEDAIWESEDAIKYVIDAKIEIVAEATAEIAKIAKIAK